MDSNERRERIVKILRDQHKPLSGSRLADDLGVSRQAIVQDIAVLRAAGQEIMATPQGYVMLSTQKNRPRRVFATQHDADRIADELNTIVSKGGRIIDVVVEHPLYGEIRGLLMLSSLKDITEYLAQYKESGAEPLSALTKGVHLHTVEAEDEGILDQVAEALEKKGYLLSQA